jgi:DtxR family Mn-dependent transcriptional regulator
LARFLDNPVADPHGHRIPDGSSHAASIPGEALITTRVGSNIVVTSIDDHDAAVVRRLAALGVLPGMRAVIVGNDGDSIRLRAGRRRLNLSNRTLRGVRCTASHGREQV